MPRQVPLCAAALLMIGATTALVALAFVPRTMGQSATNINGNMNSSAGGAPHGGPTIMNDNMSRADGPRPAAAAPRLPAPRPTPPPPWARWVPVAPVPGFVYASPLRLRAGARAAVVEELRVDLQDAEVLEVAGEFLRVRVSAAGAEGQPGRNVEGWVVWGEVVPLTTALILDARTGRVLARHALGHGISAVSFSFDGKRALYHGNWAPAIYEADASDLAPARQLIFDAEGSFAAAVYAGAGYDLFAPFRGEGGGPESNYSKLYAVRADGGGSVTVTPFAHAPSGADPARVAFAPDGRTGFAFYIDSGGEDEELPAGGGEERPVVEDRGAFVTVEVFDPLTRQRVRRFRLPDAALAFDPGSLAMNADGSLFYLLDQTGQRLIVVETQAGGVVQEVSLAGETPRLLSLVRETVDGAGPLVRYWPASEEHHGDPRTLRLDGGQAVEVEAGYVLTVEAGGARYAVDEQGMRLLTLDDAGRPAKAHDIPRREGDYQVPAGLFATPDGSRLILLLTVPEDGC